MKAGFSKSLWSTLPVFKDFQEFCEALLFPTTSPDINSPTERAHYTSMKTKANIQIQLSPSKLDIKEICKNVKWYPSNFFENIDAFQKTCVIYATM